MPNSTDNQPIDAVWPPPPSTTQSTAVDAADTSFRLSGVDYTQTADRALIDNRRARASSIVSWLSQVFVLALTLRVQYESMLWFQNVWGFRGRAVIIEIALQALVWIGMAVAYFLIDRAKYNQYCRFRTTFDRVSGHLMGADRAIAPLDGIAAVDVRRQSSLFAHWYEVRLLLPKSGPKADYDAVDERILAGFHSEVDAHRLADVVTTFLCLDARSFR